MDYIACQAPWPMGLSWQEDYSGLPFPPPELSYQSRDQIHVSALTGGCFTTEPPGKPPTPVHVARIQTYDLDIFKLSAPILLGR